MESPPLTPPRIYLVRMAVFLVLAGLIAFILYRQIFSAFLANPGLNALIIGVMLIGIHPGDPAGLAAVPRGALGQHLPPGRGGPRRRPAGAARADGGLIANRAGRIGALHGDHALAARFDRRPASTRAARSSRYIAGLLVFLGLLGTFWGLIDTVGSVGGIIALAAHRAGRGSALRRTEERPRRRRSRAWACPSRPPSSASPARWSLGFLDLQAGQAQNRFYTELEDWLATSTTTPATEARPPRRPRRARGRAQPAPAAVSEGGGGRGRDAGHGQPRRGHPGPRPAHARRAADDPRLGRGAGRAREGAEADPRSSLPERIG